MLGPGGGIGTWATRQEPPINKMAAKAKTLLASLFLEFLYIISFFFIEHLRKEYGFMKWVLRKKISNFAKGKKGK